ncbi:MAG TPA: penicillin-binding protein activator [Xanthobacteraceae bacterium]|jgi:ABC-type branched-subunit amino acid transport system substrate-binding protein
MLQSFGTRASAAARKSCLAVVLSAALLAGCSGNLSKLLQGSPPNAAAPAHSAGNLGEGHVKVGFILPLSGGGNAAAAAQSMRQAAEMALAEFSNPDLQLLVKDDAGNAPGAQQAAQQALDEGAEIILGPLFALTVGPVGQVAKSRGVPVIAFSTDSNVASRGVYLLSFLPESDVDRIVGYAAGQGKLAFAALVPDNAYGTVVEAEFKQTVARRGGRVVALERYPLDRAQMQGPVRNVAQAAARADAIFIPDTAEWAGPVVQGLIADGIDAKRVQLLGTGLWEDAQIFSNPQLEGAWYAGPDSTGFRNFSARYRSRFGQDPARTASLAYDAVALVAALVKTQGKQRFAESVLTNSSGFTGIDGLFRFRPNGSNQRGLAVLRVSPTGGQIVSAPPKSFTGSGT